MPSLSVIILNYRTPEDTIRCVQNVLSSTFADQMEIIIVDNHSLDDSIGVLRNRCEDDTRIKIVEAPVNSGFGKGNNRGARNATGKYILILNPDTKPDPDAIEQLIHRLEEDPTIGIIAPKLVFPDGVIRDSYRTFPTLTDIIIKRTFLRKLFPKRLARYLLWDEKPEIQTDVDWVVGAFMLMRRSLYQELKGFDERFFLFFEDADLCRRCWESGKRVVYVPEMKAKDGKTRLSGTGFFSMLFSRTGRVHIASACKYFWKWRNTPLPHS